MRNLPEGGKINRFRLFKLYQKSRRFCESKSGRSFAKVEEFKLDAVQLHGNESPSQCADIQVKDVEVIKAFSVDDSFDFAALDAYQESCNLLLFDAKGENYGGNGIRFNWELLKQYQGKLPFLLSGGIRLQDIKEIMVIQHSKFLGIDVNSGFEISPGVKDINEIEKMLKKVKSHEQVSS